MWFQFKIRFVDFSVSKREREGERWFLSVDLSCRSLSLSLLILKDGFWGTGSGQFVSNQFGPFSASETFKIILDGSDLKRLFFVLVFL